MAGLVRPEPMRCWALKLVVGALGGSPKFSLGAGGTPCTGRREWLKRMPKLTHAGTQSDAQLPAWWHLIPTSFAQRCNYRFIADWHLSAEACNLRQLYVDRFGEAAAKKRIPLSNWQRADFCWQTVPRDCSLIDVGSGLGEFVNLFALNNDGVPVASVDTRDWDLWFDATGHIERIYKSIYDLGDDDSRDVVTCFEVIEHLPPERLEEAVAILRRLAKRRLFVSVPFMEPPPGCKGHRTRFTDRNLLELFPDAEFTVLAKARSADKLHAWIFFELDTAAPMKPEVQSSSL